MPNAKGKPARRDAFADLGGAGGAAQYFAPQNPVGVEDLAEAKSIAVDLLESNPYQPRTTFDKEALAELAADIKEHGVLQPLLVRSHPDAKGRYQIVAGERRLRAATVAGLPEVPCIERTLGDDEMERLALVENIQRSNLDPVDEAHAFKRLVAKGASNLSIAQGIHKHHEYVAQRLRLIEDPRVEKMVRHGLLGATVAQEIVRLKDSTRRDAFLAQAERREEITVQQVRNALAEERKSASARSSGAANSSQLSSAPTGASSHAAGQSPIETFVLKEEDLDPTRGSAHEFAEALRRIHQPDRHAHHSEPSPETRQGETSKRDGLKAALGALDVAAAVELARFGAAEGWSCAQLVVALKAMRSDAAG